MSKQNSKPCSIREYEQSLTDSELASDNVSERVEQSVYILGLISEKDNYNSACLSSGMQASPSCYQKTICNRCDMAVKNCSKTAINHYSVISGVQLSILI